LLLLEEISQKCGEFFFEVATHSKGFPQKILRGPSTWKPIKSMEKDAS
jgi:hypothetical protein